MTCFPRVPVAAWAALHIRGDEVQQAMSSGDMYTQTAEQILWTAPYDWTYVLCGAANVMLNLTDAFIKKQETSQEGTRAFFAFVGFAALSGLNAVLIFILGKRLFSLACTSQTEHP